MNRENIELTHIEDEEKDNIDYDTPVEVGIFNVEIDREECLIDTNENTISYVELKIRSYKDRVDSEKRMRIYAINEHKNNTIKAKVSVGIAILLSFTVGISLSNITNYLSIGALLMIPMLGVFFLGSIVCIINSIVRVKNANIVMDPHSAKYKNWAYIVSETRAREKVYIAEIERLEILLQEMIEEKERQKDNLRKIEEDREKKKS